MRVLPCEKIPKLDRFIGVWKYLDEITEDNKYSKNTEKETYLMNYYKKMNLNKKCY